MTHVICKLTAKNRDQLRNPTLGNRVWAAFAFSVCYSWWAEDYRRLWRRAEATTRQRLVGSTGTRTSGANVRLVGHYLRRLRRQHNNPPAAHPADNVAGLAAVAPEAHRTHCARHNPQQQQAAARTNHSYPATERTAACTPVRRYNAAVDDVISTEF